MFLTLAIGLPTFVWIAFFRFPPIIEAYNQQLRRARFFSQSRYKHAGGHHPHQEGAGRTAQAPPALSPSSALARGSIAQVEIRRFGPGHRRPEGPPGTTGLTGQVIWSDERANVSELAFSRRGVIPPHENPNTALFIVVSGGGFVQVGDERIRINHGEAVVWPPNVPHGAYTDGVEMRAIVVELTEGLVSLDCWERSAGSARSFLPPCSKGTAADFGTHEPVTGGPRPAAGATPPPSVEPARGQLAERPTRRDDHDESEGEPW